MFRIIFVSVAVLLFSYLGLQLTSHGDLADWARYSIWAWLFLVFGFMILMPFYLWRFRGESTPPKIIRLMTLGHNVMAYLNFLIPVVIIRDLVAFVFGVLLNFDLQPMYSAEASAVMLLLPFVFKYFGAKTIAKGPVVYKKEISDQRLPQAFANFNILQISDLHISHYLKKGFTEKVIEKVNALNPDIIFLTGDIVDGPVDDFQGEVAKLKDLKAKHGIYFVPGNHEYYWDFAKIEKAIISQGIISIPNSSRRLQKDSGQLLIAGVSDPAAAHYQHEPPKLDQFKKDFQDDQYRILLAHQPFMADKAAEVGFHFQLSGHTHGGQFFPWNFLIGFFQKYAKGFYQVGDMKLYVNQGTGYWGPALRIGTQCELTQIILKN